MLVYLGSSPGHLLWLLFSQSSSRGSLQVSGLDELLVITAQPYKILGPLCTSGRMDWLPTEVVLAITAHLDARDICKLACVSRGLRRSVASASLSFTAAGTTHIQFRRGELECGAAQTALKAFLERNASRVRSKVIPAYSWDNQQHGKDSNFLCGATRLQSLHINLRYPHILEGRGVLPQSLTSLTYVGWSYTWSNSESENWNFNWAPFTRLTSLRELHMHSDCFCWSLCAGRSTGLLLQPAHGPAHLP